MIESEKKALGKQIDSINEKLGNIQDKELDNATLKAAKIEQEGGSVGTNPRTGVKWNHVRKVQQAIRGLNNLKEETVDLLKRTDITPKTRAGLVRIIRTIADEMERVKSAGISIP